MHRFRTVGRTLFGSVFCSGGIMHLVAGRAAPKGYAAFGGAAMWPWFADLWDSVVTPRTGG